MRTDMGEMELISVIVPVYKVEKYLDRCIKSIAGQSYPKIEIILVDDGSPDSCPAMCDNWAKKDSRIRVIHEPHGGPSDARNAGLKQAVGQYIGFVDSDDWIAPEMYERLLNAIHADQSDIAACAVQMVWEDDTPSRMLTEQANCILDRQEAQEALLAETLLKQPVWYKLYRRETISGIAFEKGKYHEDAFWSYQVIGNAGRVSLIDYTGYYYLQRSGSIMGEDYSLKRLDAMEAYGRRYEYIKQNFPELECRSLCAITTSCIYHGQMALRFLPKAERRQAMQYLNAVKRRYPVKHKDYAVLKFSHRFWISLSRISLPGVCRLKNLFGVGL